MHRAFCRTVSSLAKNKGLPPGPKSRYIVRMQKDAGQRLLALQRVFALFCVLLVFMFVGIVFLLSSKAYASGIVVRSLTENMSRLANTPIVPTPTNTPIIPTPTNTPIPAPTNTPIVLHQQYAYRTYTDKYPSFLRRQIRLSSYTNKYSISCFLHRQIRLFLLSPLLQLQQMR